MKRRHVIALGAATIGTTLLPSALLAEDLAPVAMAEFGQGRERRVIRVYPGTRAGEILVHVRHAGRSTLRRMRLSGDPSGMLRGLDQDGLATFAASGITANITTTGARGIYDIDGVGPVPVVTNNEAVIIVPLGTFVVAALATAFLQGVVIGFTTSQVIEATSSGGGTQAEAEAEEESTGEGIIASPECDGPPIRLC